MRMVLFFHLVTLVVLLDITIVFGGNTTCIDQSITWYNNENGESPCLVFERLMQVCVPTFDMWSIGYPPSYRDCDGDSCCCNTVAYALHSACWSCQWGTEYPSNNPETFGTFLGNGLSSGPNDVFCPADTNFNVFPSQYATAMKNDPIPLWAFVGPVEQSDVWSYSVAQTNATKELALSSSISMLSTQSIASTASVASASAVSASAAAAHKKRAAIAGGVVGGIAALALISAASIFFLLGRRRGYKPDVEPVTFTNTSEWPGGNTPIIQHGFSPVASSAWNSSTLSQPSQGVWPDPQVPTQYLTNAGSTYPMPNFAPAGSKEEANRMRDTYMMTSITQSTPSGPSHSSGSRSTSAPSRTSSIPPIPVVMREEDAGLRFVATPDPHDGDLPPAYQPANQPPRTEKS